MSRPPAALLERQAEWLAPARSALLRRAEIGRRRRVLDLGAGSGAVTPELARRSAGSVTAVDRDALALAAIEVAVPSGTHAVRRACADGRALPFADGAFDLVFCQCVLMWAAGQADDALDRLAAEARRVLAPGGVWAVVEPDFGGLVEHPPEIAVRDLWLSALAHAGADPYVGRRVPGCMASAGFEVRVDLFAHLVAPDPGRFALLEGLPLTDAERSRLAAAVAADAALGATAWGRVAHLPFMLALGSRPADGLARCRGS